MKLVFLMVGSIALMTGGCLAPTVMPEATENATLQNRIKKLEKVIGALEEENRLLKERLNQRQSRQNEGN